MDPVSILQEFLDEMGLAVLNGDWQTYAARVSLPFNLVTQGAEMVIEDETELRRGFDVFHGTLRSQKVTDYIRLTDRADRIDERLIHGGYVSHLLADGKHVVPPYRSQIVLQLSDGLWRASTISNGLVNDRWPLLVPKPDPSGDGPEPAQ